MTNFIDILDAAIMMLPVAAAVGFLLTVGLRSFRRFA
jgi:hypothetical protein